MDSFTTLPNELRKGSGRTGAEAKEEEEEARLVGSEQRHTIVWPRYSWSHRAWVTLLSGKDWIWRRVE